LKTENGLKKFVGVHDLTGDLSINMLAESWRLIDALHLVQDFFVEEGRGENFTRVRMLNVCLISGISIVELISARGLPLVSNDQSIIEDFLGIDLDKTAISVICDSTTVVCLGDQILNSLPRKGSLLIIGLSRLVVLQSTHVNSHEILADAVV
jgi:hypothetical protein